MWRFEYSNVAIRCYFGQKVGIALRISETYEHRLIKLCEALVKSVLVCDEHVRKKHNFSVNRVLHLTLVFFKMLYFFQSDLEFFLSELRFIYLLQVFLNLSFLSVNVVQVVLFIFERLVQFYKFE